MGECIWYARLLWLWGSRFHARDSTKNTPSPASGRGETTKQPHPDCHALTQIPMVSYPPFTISSHRIRIFEKPFIEQQAGNLTFPASRGKSAYAPLSFFVAGPAEPEAILLCCIVEMTFHSLSTLMRLNRSRKIDCLPFCRSIQAFSCLHTCSVRSILASLSMTEYHFQEKPVPANSVNAAKEQRRKVLDGVFQRRRLIYQRNNLRQVLAHSQHRNNAPDED